MHELKDIELLVKARTPLILIETSDLERAEQLAVRLAISTRRNLFGWSLTEGLKRLDIEDAPPMRQLQEPPDALAHIASLTTPALFVMQDLHRCLDNATVISGLRQIVSQSESRPHALLLVAPEIKLPAELRACSARLSLSAPSAIEMEQMIENEARRWSEINKRRVKTSRELVDALIRNLQGLGTADARRLVRNAINDDGLLTDCDLPDIMQAKYKLLDQGGVLSFELETAHLADVAGLSRLKTWLEQRRSVFTANKPPPGLDPPKGLLLLGVQGAGKSLAAKAVAGAWQLPLLRLDFATLYNKYHGETERNLRESLNTAGQMAPCVLWIDEIEKGLSFDRDGGPGKRILGTLLTWMAERQERVFLVATANDIEALPPELLRKGRFDEIFFVDLPTAEVRVAIFSIHLKKREQHPADFDCLALAEASEGFTGAEIEQAVVSALYAAHTANESLTTAHVAQALKETRPLSVLMAEKIAHLRQWAAERTVPAE